MNTTDFKQKFYLNRELSWLSFNDRVLEEATDPNNPLLEKLKFVAITSSNLDEFFMIRVAGLRHQKENGVTRKDIAGMTPEQQLQHISESAQHLVAKQYMYLKKILNALELEGLYFVKPRDLTKGQLEWLRDYFEREIFPVVTPMAVDSSHPFPFLASKSLNLAMLLEKIERTGDDDNDIDVKTAIVPVPSVLSRIIALPEDKERKGCHDFVLLEDVIRHFAQQLFMGYDLLEAHAFRITRDADLYIDEEDAKDLVVEVERQLKKRQKGEAVRVEFERGTSRFMQRFITQSLNLVKNDLYEIDGPIDTTMYFRFCGIPGYDKLRYPEAHPYTPWSMIQSHEKDIFSMIREKDMLVHLPYESFDESVVNFVMSAATDPDVLAIKQTLYRVSSRSPIIWALEKAAQNGKQVTVLMEVKARFDEENNIHMARRLEKAGAHVIYGLVGLKTHSKCTLIIRREKDGIRRYVHVATGNYNASTAKLYTDLGIFTCSDTFGADASAFFNLLSGYSDPPVWDSFLVAPINLRERCVALIDREIQHVKNGENGHIIAKMNSLLDSRMVDKLYEASQAGVKIELIVRGICVLIPGIPGVSDNITVRSLVGRFLEHSRVFWFNNGGREELYIGSADWMPRNLNDRVELMIPVKDTDCMHRIKNMVLKELEDNQKAHIMQSNGTWVKMIASENKVCAQEYFQKLAEQRGEQEKMTLKQKFEPYVPVK
ncbi:MAG: RNA degradosome polyphosphate kinase [Allisonella histaminiformans]|nr:RNA degradosome polyphosphate kinase [Allisonella histaminiformans]MCI6003356.1 RNA degradosome polyphosphate kinase [Allisonella histaminiformans]MDD6870498.1 RNA degradosome polyphosphate kinase [Allisonella histaminiformans]MDY3957660.1 RNA degradosome polyphosphate kinase [Allisonella histaminiformans]PWL47291.1 MAG: RNA degradosome polyphosphate kinase [Veillonellaceae bacterium]